MVDSIKLEVSVVAKRPWSQVEVDLGGDCRHSRVVGCSGLSSESLAIAGILELPLFWLCPFS